MIFIYAWGLVKIRQNRSKHAQQKITLFLGHPGLKMGENLNPPEIFIHSYMFEFCWKLVHSYGQNPSKHSHHKITLFFGHPGLKMANKL